MATDKVHLCHCILYELQQRRNATAGCRNLLKVLGEDPVSDRAYRRCTKNLKQVISTFLISHVIGDHLWSTTMCWGNIGAKPFSDNIGYRRKTSFSSTDYFWPYRKIIEKMCILFHSKNGHNFPVNLIL